MDKTATDQKFIAIGILIVFGLILLIILIVASRKDTKETTPTAYMQLDNTNTSLKKENSVGVKIFQDKVCNISFSIPAGWSQSATKLPLPQAPLAQIVFDENSKKSIFSYICYSDKYTFSQFIGDSTNLSAEPLKIGGIDFNRVGNFVYFNKGNKLIVLQMFFTKNDINPIAGYEEKLQVIMASIK